MFLKRLNVVASAFLIAGTALVSGGGTALASASTEVVNLSASGTGEQEVPAGVGEPGAKVTGSFQLTPAGALTYTVKVSGNSQPIIMGHIHVGGPGENGDVQVPLSEASINAGTTNTTQMDPALAKKIIANPADYYLNVHSANFISTAGVGVARGQLTAASGAPSVINTGTGGQAAEDAGGLTGSLPAVAGLGVLLAAGAVTVARRRSAGSAS